MTAAGWLIIGLVLAVVALALIIVWLVSRLLDLEADFEDQHDANHAMCIAHIADFTSKRVVALNLREYARRWESVEEKPNLTRLAREHYRPGLSMPTLWLNQQADLLDPAQPEESIEDFTRLLLGDNE